MSPETFNSDRQGPTVLSPWTLACCFVVCKYSLPGGAGNLLGFPATPRVQDPSMGSVLPFSAALPSSKWYPWKGACSVRSICWCIWEQGTQGAQFPVFLQGDLGPCSVSQREADGCRGGGGGGENRKAGSRV